MKHFFNSVSQVTKKQILAKEIKKSNKKNFVFFIRMPEI